MREDQLHLSKIFLVEPSPKCKEHNNFRKRPTALNMRTEQAEAYYKRCHLHEWKNI